MHWTKFKRNSQMVLRYAFKCVTLSLPLLLTVLLSIPSFGAEVFRPREDAIVIIGSLDQNTLANVSRLFNKNVKVLSIVSLGGDVVSGINLGRFIRDNNLTLVVSNYCLNACSQYVFVAARQRLIAPNTIIAFSATASALKLIVSNDINLGVRKFFDKRAAEEVAFYDAIGIPRDFLYLPPLKNMAQCYNPSFDSNGGVSDVRINGKFYGWVPNKNYINSIAPFSGFWPTTIQELGEATMPGKFKENIPFAAEIIQGPHQENGADVKAELKTLHRCAASVNSN